MKAVLVREFGPLGTAKVEDVAVPQPAAHEVLVEVAFAPANFVDTLVLEGKYQFLPERPFVPGKGPVGTVRAVGANVTRFKVGDRVLAMAEHGGYAEQVCVDAEQCYGLPDALPFEGAASISLAFDTAWFALVERARLASGDVILVLGALGAVGRAAVQLAKAKGATVIAGISGLSRSQQALEIGADHVVDLSAENLRDNLREQVYAINGGKGVDIVIDPLGDDMFDAALRALAWRGRLVVVGFAAGRIPTLKANYLLLKNIEVSGLQISDYRKRMPDLVRECFEDIFALYVAGKIQASPSTLFPLEAYDEALKAILERRVSGRALLVPTNKAAS